MVAIKTPTSYKPIREKKRSFEVTNDCDSFYFLNCVFFRLKDSVSFFYQSQGTPSKARKPHHAMELTRKLIRSDFGLKRAEKQYYLECE